MKDIVKDMYLGNPYREYPWPSRGKYGLRTFIDFPKHLLHMKEEEFYRYYLMYYSNVESKAMKDACRAEGEDLCICMYDNSYFEYSQEGKVPSMDEYRDNIKKCHPDIIMVDVDYDEYVDNANWSGDARKMLDLDDDILMMAIPHTANLKEFADIIMRMNWDEQINIIGVSMCSVKDHSRIDAIAYCIANYTWCWRKSVHLLGLSCSNEILIHSDLIKICRNIISIDTSFPVLLACENKELTVTNVKGKFRFNEDKPSFSLLGCPEPSSMPALECLVEKNIELFRDAISDATFGYSKIAFVGAAGTGKTTIVDDISSILRAMGQNIASLKYPPLHKICDYREEGNKDDATLMYFGCNIMLADLQYDKNVIFDRCIIDNIAYAKYNKNKHQEDMFKKAYSEFAEHSYTNVVLVDPLENIDIEEDGKRVTDKDVQRQIHQCFIDTLNELGVGFIELPGTFDVRERRLALLQSI